ncbi:hypothetical protein AOT82_2042 [Psychrobacter sp. AntiMn-1]|nr:hypothetical protein AOT82_2042 [Psychrobacter sp. AntiMn-1]
MHGILMCLVLLNIIHTCDALLKGRYNVKWIEALGWQPKKWLSIAKNHFFPCLQS